MKAQWSSLVQQARSTCDNFSGVKPQAKALRCAALALPLLVGLNGCSDLNSNAEIEILHKQTEQISQLQRLEADTARNTLRAALEDPRLHPYALARAVFEQSGARVETPAFLVQFSATLLDAKAAPDLIDDLIEELLQSFEEISRQNEFLAEYSSIFYMRLLAMSSKTANHERTEQLRLQVEALIEAEGNESFSNIELLQYYLEGTDLARAEYHLERLGEGFARTSFSLELIDAHLERGDYYEAQRLIDNTARQPEWLQQFIKDWVAILLRADRREEAVDFVLHSTQAILEQLSGADDHYFYSLPNEILTRTTLLQELGRHEEAREAMLTSYRYSLLHEPQSWYLLQATLPYIKGFAALGEPVLFNEVKNWVFNRIYQNLEEDDFHSFMANFVFNTQALEIEEFALEFLDVVAGYNDVNERIPAAEFAFFLGYAYGALGHSERSDYYLQPLLNDSYRFQTLFESTLSSSMKAVEYLLEAGYVDEIKDYIGATNSFWLQYMLIEKLTADQRFVDALEQIAILDMDAINEAFFLLMVAKGYLEQEILPNAEAREVMALNWQRYMPMDE